MLEVVVGCFWEGGGERERVEGGREKRGLLFVSFGFLFVGFGLALSFFLFDDALFYSSSRCSARCEKGQLAARRE